MNPFWHLDRRVPVALGPDECRRRLKRRPDSAFSLSRAWFGGSDGTFYLPGPRVGPLLQMHVRVTVEPGQDMETSTLLLRFSGGTGSALLLVAIELSCLVAFAWAVMSIATAGWNWFPAAGLIAAVIPVLLVLAMRAAVPDDTAALTRLIARQLDG